MDIIADNLLHIQQNIDRKNNKNKKTVASTLTKPSKVQIERFKLKGARAVNTCPIENLHENAKFNVLLFHYNRTVNLTIIIYME
jgi:hypothetical protein